MGTSFLFRFYENPAPPSPNQPREISQQRVALWAAEPLSLPAQWLWDIIDEFIQFQSFALFRSRPATKADDELVMLASEGGAQAWSSYTALILHPKEQCQQMTQGRAEGKADDEIAYLPHKARTRQPVFLVHVLLSDFIQLQSLSDY